MRRFLFQSAKRTSIRSACPVPPLHLNGNRCPTGICPAIERYETQWDASATCTPVAEDRPRIFWRLCALPYSPSDSRVNYSLHGACQVDLCYLLRIKRLAGGRRAKIVIRRERIPLFGKSCMVLILG